MRSMPTIWYGLSARAAAAAAICDTGSSASSPRPSARRGSFTSAGFFPLSLLMSDRPLPLAPWRP